MMRPRPRLSLLLGLLKTYTAKTGRYSATIQIELIMTLKPDPPCDAMNMKVPSTATRGKTILSPLAFFLYATKAIASAANPKKLSAFPRYTDRTSGIEPLKNRRDQAKAWAALASINSW
jgi:hypothetical protein